MNELFRAIPSVNKLLDMLNKHAQAELAYDPHSPNTILACSPPLLTTLINEYLDILRENINKRKITHVDQMSNEILLKEVLNYIYKVLQPNLQKVINGTGVVIHTNLGRALLSKSAIQAIHLAASSYVNLEFNMETGERGSRHDVVLSRLKRITKAEDALVVNNNAAAVLLVLDALAKNGETIISRGELVEVGGSFRIPEVMEHSGTTLKEVGTTNRTHLEDYLKAINENTKVLMRVHTSNFRVIGFSSAVPTQELAEVAKNHDIPLIEDLGSGSFVDFSPYGLPKEPTVQEAIEQGVDVVTFSGDKLLGGPQAGIIVGKKKYIDIIRKNQLLRALRPCKLTLAALEATLNLYLQPETLKDNVPTLKMIALSYNDVLAKAQVLQSTLVHYIKPKKAKITLHEDSSRVGGGAFPEFPLPTVLVQILPQSISSLELKERFLQSTPAVVGRLDEKCFSLDARTIADYEFDIIARILNEIL